MTVAAPRLSSPNDAELHVEAMNFVQEALQNLWAIDKELAVLVFPTKAHLKKLNLPLLKLWVEPPDRTTFQRYTAQLFVKRGWRPYVRLYLGHNVEGETLFGPDLQVQLEGLGIGFSVDTIQASKVITCGFLVGTYMTGFNLEHYNAILASIPKFAQHPVAVVRRNILRYPGEKTPNVPAAHVLCDGEKRIATVRLLKAQFNRCNPKDLATLPDGKVYRFCPSAVNSNDRVQLDVGQHRAQHCRAVQKKFLEAHTHAVVHGVADLDFAIDFGLPHGVQTLRQVLLGMKTQQEWSWPLFMSVDYDAYRGEIMAVFHKEGASEAQTILSYLPIFLEERFGSKVWQWFSSTCKTELSPYCWDAVSQAVVLRDLLEPEPEFRFFSSSVAPAAWETVDDDDTGDEPMTEVLTFDLELYFDPAPCHGRGSGVLGSDHSNLTMNTGCSQVTSKLHNGTLNIPDEPTGGAFKGKTQTEVLELDSCRDNSDSVHETGDGVPVQPPVGTSKGNQQTEVVDLDSSSEDSDSVHEIGVGIGLEVSQDASSSGSASSGSSFSSVPIGVSPSPNKSARSGASMQQTGVDSEND